MRLSLTERLSMFGIIKDCFDWISKDFLMEEDFYDEFYERDFDLAFTLFFGSTKFCLVCEEFGDYVIKFSSVEYDYCKREYHNYLRAIEEGVKEYFAYTEFLGTFNGVNFYAQERVLCDEDSISKQWCDSLRESDDFWYNWGEDKEFSKDELQEYIFERVEDMEDEDRIRLLFSSEDLVNFILNYHINDLHEGNFGWNDNGIVIIDFSGYGFAVEELEV